MPGQIQDWPEPSASEAETAAQTTFEAYLAESGMTNKDQVKEFDELKNRVHSLERALAVVIDVLKDEVDKTDAYGLFKRMKKLSAAPGMKATLDGAKKLIGTGD